ncbi:M23 family metallopeptidase [Chitinolyticbacter albus]|uniref:M23 family metallopeptidase n=1 Tax=Chitinolyticbacter albus TaxID=2961951 RepID=UPI00210BF03B|nr:M23 family metallopeptidase [Chitinolyticbacter albus]
MSEVADGMYPVARNLCWHGGIHLEAPSVDRQPLPVRAIADGIVRCARPASANQSGDPEHAQSYGGWTDNGVVVIEHTTEIGAAANDTPVTVRFYSIYQHLIEVPRTLRLGQRVYRKAELGHAGYIDGQPNRIHFEIACDNANLQLLIGRNQGQVATEQDGRSNVVFGEIYVRLPSGTPIYTLPEGHRLLDNNPAAQSQGPEPRANAPRPPAQPLAASMSTTIDCYVGLRYAMGDGPINERGDLTVTTYREDGSVCGQRSEAGAEYDIFSRAKAISQAYAAPNQPIRSAVYELLRFGRVINTANETLTPADVPHWRAIIVPTANGTGTQTGWVNLNNQAQGQQVRVFSDADFPHWRGWQLFNDDLSAGDSRCDSDAIKTLLDVDGDHHVTPNERLSRMQDAQVRSKLRHAICPMPSEWNAADLQARWDWLQTTTEENPEPLVGDSYTDFIAHAQALSFEAPQAFAATWRFHPRGFIEAFRYCMWFGLEEFAQCLPRQSLSAADLPWDMARTRAQTHYIPLNRLFQKYKGHSKQRIAHSLAQVYIETGLLRTLFEDGRGRRYVYGAFYGRGYHQLTWAGNYEQYGKYKGIPNQRAPVYSDTRITLTSTHAKDSGGTTMNWSPRYDPAIVGENTAHAAESSGFYWVSKSFRRRTNINRACDLAFNQTSLAFICWLINGGGNGYADRQQFAKYLANMLFDAPPLTGSETYRYPPLEPPADPPLCRTFPPTEVVYTLNGTVNYVAQRPA